MKQEYHATPNTALYNVLDSDVTPPVTLQELRERLKHIATLCTSLSIDLSEEIEYRFFLEQKVLDLQLQLAKRKEPKRHFTPEHREKQSQALRKYWANRHERDKHKQWNVNAERRKDNDVEDKQ